jgi:hypothetical protein
MSACTWFENEDIKTKERVKKIFMKLLLVIFILIIVRVCYVIVTG